MLKRYKISQKNIHWHRISISSGIKTASFVSHVLAAILLLSARLDMFTERGNILMISTRGLNFEITKLRRWLTLRTHRNVPNQLIGLKFHMQTFTYPYNIRPIFYSITLMHKKSVGLLKKSTVSFGQGCMLSLTPHEDVIVN